VGQNQKHIQELKPDRRHAKEVDWYQVLCLILKKGPQTCEGGCGCPTGSWRRWSGQCRCPLLQFAADAGCSLKCIPTADLAYQLSHSFRDGRRCWPCRTFTVQNRLKHLRCHSTTISGLTMRRADRHFCQIPHSRPQEPIAVGQFGARRRALQDRHLTPQHEVHQMECGSGLEDYRCGSSSQPEERHRSDLKSHWIESRS